MLSSSIKQWLFNIVCTILLTSIILIILPSKRMGVLIKAVFTFVVILSIVKPIFSIDLYNFDLGMLNVSEEIVVQSNFLNYAINEKEQQTSNEVKMVLNEIGIKDAEVQAICNFDSENGIYIDVIEINLINSVIISDKEHIDIIEVINKTICELFKVDKKDIVIYE